MHLRHLVLAASAALALCLAPGVYAPAWAESAAAAASDTPEKTSSGVTFTQPAGWALVRHDKFVVLNAPEPDTHLALVDVGSAKDVADAAAKAWAMYRADFHRPVKLVTPRAARQGWDERQVVDYETSPNEKMTIQAVAFRAKTNWTVLLIDASDATAEKRLAAIGLVVQSLRPAGYTREMFTGRTAHQLDAARIEQIRSFVETAMKQLGVPGAGLALIEHGKIVYEGGVGVRELGKPEPVDAHTLFMVASNTKGMSTLLLAELVDQGKLRWDQRVTDVYPQFRLGSDETTRQVTIRHLVCACTGLPRKDFEWIFNTRAETPAATTFTQLAGTQPTSRFGEVFQYNNLMASAAGYIGGHIVHPDMELGRAYDTAMQSMIFDPLGMHDTTFDMARAIGGNHASPHAWDVDGKASNAPMDLNYAVAPYRPAGGVWSSAHDMILYVQNELTRGKLPNGQRLVSEQNLLKRREASVPIGEDAWYGMGLEVDKTWGVEVVHHGGSLIGYKSDWIAIPDADVGAVLITNADEGQFMLRPFMRRVLEVLYDGRPEAAEDAAIAAARTHAELAKERERVVIPADPALAANLATHYSNADLGHIAVLKSGNSVTFDFGLWKSTVGTRKNDDGTVSFVTIDPGAFGFPFVAGTQGGKRTLTVRDGQHEYVYIEG